MFPINIFGAIKGLVSGATNGVINVDDAVDIATKIVAKDKDVPLTNAQAKPVAEAIAQQMPSPKAMEGLEWQNVRSLIIAAGGYFVGRGFIDDAQLQIIAGFIMIILPIVYRNLSTWWSRYTAKS